MLHSRASLTQSSVAAASGQVLRLAWRLLSRQQAGVGGQVLGGDRGGIRDAGSATECWRGQVEGAEADGGEDVVEVKHACGGGLAEQLDKAGGGRGGVFAGVVFGHEGDIDADRERFEGSEGSGVVVTCRASAMVSSTTMFGIVRHRSADPFVRAAEHVDVVAGVVPPAPPGTRREMRGSGARPERPRARRTMVRR